EDYTRIFGFRPPFPTICEPEYVTYVQDTGSSLTDSLEALLGGVIKLLSTSCISRQFPREISDYRDAMLEECGHRELSRVLCMRNFVREYPSRAQVVCTMNSRDHYARVPGRIIVTPNRGGGIFIDSQAIPSMIEHFNWMHRVRHTHLNLFKRLRDEILNSGSKSKGVFTLRQLLMQLKKMMEIAASGMQQPKEVLNAQGVDFELSTALQKDNSLNKNEIKEY
nr:hypothetical protein [Tanacetum cinerariifolium]